MNLGSFLEVAWFIGRLFFCGPNTDTLLEVGISEERVNCYWSLRFLFPEEKLGEDTLRL